MRLETLTGDAIGDALEDVARLRIAVFRDWPYLYDGDLAYERRYLQNYQVNAGAIVIGVYDGDWLVGASTGAPLADHADDFQDALTGSGLDVSTTFYCGESVLLPRYRGQGIGGQFFDRREAQARTLGHTHICFCAVVRPPDHPLHPTRYRSLERFWEKRGYARLPGAVAHFSWKDVDQPAETKKPLQFWMRQL
ncbi:GNAT family N-acetyltransferase [Tateyamaria pelophila]|uniref:GNAT family N-acetyltransferase n=1 Tax=Tateyamaria pelophila TaxID=328415 RepID=UPI001CBE6E16|nr:GNAT family N-acetyltransferase [Tateyamaria pelophila]